MWDVRKPADLYVDDILDSILRDVFRHRARVEQTMTRGELIAYDHVIAKMLDPQVLMDKLKYEIQRDRDQIMQFGEVAL